MGGGGGRGGELGMGKGMGWEEEGHYDGQTGNLLLWQSKWFLVIEQLLS